jgi:hypothetical protein
LSALLATGGNANNDVIEVAVNFRRAAVRH